MNLKLEEKKYVLGHGTMGTYYSVTTEYYGTWGKKYVPGTYRFMSVYSGTIL
jgi:hypothetical protein